MNEVSDAKRIMTLLDEETLAQSEIVVNACMNRERGVVGPNSDDRELGVNPLAFLTERLSARSHVDWLDPAVGPGTPSSKRPSTGFG